VHKRACGNRSGLAQSVQPRSTRIHLRPKRDERFSCAPECRQKAIVQTADIAASARVEVRLLDDPGKPRGPLPCTSHFPSPAELIRTLRPGSAGSLYRGDVVCGGLS